MPTSPDGGLGILVGLLLELADDLTRTALHAASLVPMYDTRLLDIMLGHHDVHLHIAALSVIQRPRWRPPPRRHPQPHRHPPR